MSRLTPLVLFAILAVGLSAVPGPALKTFSALAGKDLADAEARLASRWQTQADRRWVGSEAEALAREAGAVEQWVLGLAKRVSEPAFLGNGGLVQGSPPVAVTAGNPGAPASAVRRVAQIARRVSEPQIEKTLRFSFHQPVRISVYSTPAAYGNALAGLGAPAGEVVSMTRRTGGVEDGNRILIPLFNNRAPGSLHNVVTHELTHALFYQNGILSRMPTWLNEGTAWFEGLSAEDRVSPSGVNSLLFEARASILQAFSVGKGVPLTAGEQTLLQAPYDVELQDYFAVQHLIRKDGLAGFDRMLHGVLRGGAKQAYAAVYPGSLAGYVRSFDASLRLKDRLPGTNLPSGAGVQPGGAVSGTVVQ